MPKNNLFLDCIEEHLNEAWGGGGSVYGGAAGGGAGTFSYTQTAGAKTWSPGSPPFRGMTGTPGGLNTKDLGEESEQFAKQAGQNRPYPVDQIYDHLVQGFISLQNARHQLNTSIKYNSVLDDEPAKKAALKAAEKQLQSIEKMIVRISAQIDRVTLS